MSKFKPNPHAQAAQGATDPAPGTKPLLHPLPKRGGTGLIKDHEKYITELSDPARMQEILFCIRSRVHGFSPEHIALISADILPSPISKERVLQNLDIFTKAQLVKPIEEYREIELQRLDYYLQRLSDRINSGDDKAINVALRISEHRSKLQGTFAPQKISVTTETSPPPEVMAIIEEAKRRAAQQSYQEVSVSIDNIVEAEIVEEGESDNG